MALQWIRNRKWRARKRNSPENEVRPDAESHNLAMLLHKLRGRDGQERFEAIKAIAGISFPGAIPSLIGLLGDSDRRVRANAAIALGRLRDPTTVQPLVATLRDRDTTVIDEAVKALIQIGPAAVDLLKDQLHTGHYFYAVKVLEGIAWQPTTVTERVQFGIARGSDIDSVEIINIGSAAVESLLDLLNSDEPRFRMGAASLLGKIRDKRAVNKLVEILLGDQKRDVRRSAAKALGMIGDSWAVEPLVRVMQTGGLYLNRDAATALGMIRDPSALSALVDSLRTTGEGGCASEAAAALRGIGDSSVAPLMISALQAPWAAWAVWVLGAIGDDAAVIPLLAVIADRTRH